MSSSPQAQECKSDNPSVTRWLKCLRDGDGASAGLLWGFLHQRLLTAARQQVKVRTGVYDEEDIALSAFDALCRVIQAGRYEELKDRDELWRLLAVITINKAKNRATREKRLRRGGGYKKIEYASEFLESTISPEPSSDVAMAMREECERMLKMLVRDDVRQVAIMKVEGYTNEEIADLLSCSRRSVQRRLALIRDVWITELS